MKNNLGKFLLLILFIPLLASAKVKLEVQKSYFQGDVVEFKVIASGENVVIPKIKKIGDYIVRSAGTSTQTNIFNGKKSIKKIKTYLFSPKGDIILPELEVEVDGKIYKTKPVKLTMKKVTKTDSDLYSYDINIDKKEAYVGEAIKLTINFKFRRDLNILNLEYIEPDFNNFWVKETNKGSQDSDPKYAHQSLMYVLFPQKAGKVDLGPFKINVVVSNNNYSNSFFFTGATRSIPVYSNGLSLNVKPLPRGVDLIGKFDIEAFVDKKEVEAGEAISYRIKIKGKGNIDDIKELKPQISHVTIYDNPAKKEYEVKGGIYGGEYEKVFSIVASKDFTIPPITLKYFDKDSNSVKTLQTKSFDIKVQQEQKKEVVLETAPKNIEKIQTIVKDTGVNQPKEILYGLFFILGIVVTLGGFVIYKLFNLKTKRAKEDTHLAVQAKNAKSPEELLKVIVNYINIDKDLDRIIYKLENLKDIKEFKKLKKEVVKIVKSIQIPTF